MLLDTQKRALGSRRPSGLFCIEFRDFLCELGPQGKPSSVFYHLLCRSATLRHSDRPVAIRPNRPTDGATRWRSVVSSWKPWRLTVSPKGPTILCRYANDGAARFIRAHVGTSLRSGTVEALGLSEGGAMLFRRMRGRPHY